MPALPPDRSHRAVAAADEHGDIAAVVWIAQWKQRRRPPFAPPAVPGPGVLGSHALTAHPVHPSRGLLPQAPAEPGATTHAGLRAVPRHGPALCTPLEPRPPAGSPGPARSSTAASARSRHEARRALLDALRVARPEPT